MTTRSKNTSKTSDAATGSEEEHSPRAELEHQMESFKSEMQEQLKASNLENRQNMKDMEDRIMAMFQAKFSAPMVHSAAPIDLAESSQGKAPASEDNKSPHFSPSQHVGNEANDSGPNFNGQFRSDNRVRKLEMPIFSGVNVNQWIYKAERYFQVNHLAGQEAIFAATLCLEDKAFDWWTWYSKANPVRDWNHFKEAIIQRFKGANYVDIQEQFFSLVQTRTVLEYREKFEQLAGTLEGFADSTLMANFLKGLKPEVRAEVKLFEPNSLHKAMKIAQLVEDKCSNASKPAHRPSEGRRTYYPSNAPPRPQQQQQHRPTLPERPKTNRCFKCNELWDHRHRCTDRALRHIEGPDDESQHQPSEEIADGEVSLSSVAGLTPSRTMKVKGKIGDREVIVLIDSGATHNFISPHIVRDEGLDVENRGAFNVKLGTGIYEPSQGFCPDVVIQFPEIKVKANFLPLPLGETDAILGMQWLESLGVMKVDWKSLFMEFESNGRRVRFQGEPALKIETSLKENKAADALPRKVECLAQTEVQLSSVSMQKVSNWDALHKDNESPDLDKFREAIKEGDSRYTPSGSRLFYKGRFCLPKSSKEIPTLFKPASKPPKDPRRVDQLKWYHGLQNYYKPEALRGVHNGTEGQEVLAADIIKRFPIFDLEDKIILCGAGIDEFSAAQHIAPANQSHNARKGLAQQDKGPAQSARPAPSPARPSYAPAQHARTSAQRPTQDPPDSSRIIELDQASLDETSQLKSAHPSSLQLKHPDSHDPGPWVISDIIKAKVQPS